MKKRIELKATRNGCACLETEPRYDVLFDGQKVGQLYYNMRGYRGSIPWPTEDGRVSSFDPGEISISAWKREVAAANRGFAS